MMTHWQLDSKKASTKDVYRNILLIGQSDKEVFSSQGFETKGFWKRRLRSGRSESRGYRPFWTVRLKSLRVVAISEFWVIHFRSGGKI